MEFFVSFCFEVQVGSVIHTGQIYTSDEATIFSQRRIDNTGGTEQLDRKHRNVSVPLLILSILDYIWS